MMASANPPVLLALDTGVRETGWAVFQDGQVVESGVAGLKSRRKVEPKVRISHLIASLSELADRWQPQAVAFAESTGRCQPWTCWFLHWPAGPLSVG